MSSNLKKITTILFVYLSCFLLISLTTSCSLFGNSDTEYKPGKVPTWIPHEIDNNSGAGLQVVTTDMNKDKLVDIVVSNKKGVYIFEQVR